MYIFMEWFKSCDFVILIVVVEVVRISFGLRGMDKMVNNCFED